MTTSTLRRMLVALLAIALLQPAVAHALLAPGSLGGGAAITMVETLTEGPELGPLISGTTSYVDGTFVWTDYAYDDRGPNDHPALKGGDATYPAEADPGNAADLVQLQIDLTEDGEISIRAVLNSLVHPELPLLGVGFDTDRDAGTGAANVPGEAWEVLGPLGLEVFVVLGHAGAELLEAGADGWVSVGAFDAVVDPERNTMDAVVPRSLLDPGTGIWRAVGVLGLGIDGHSWLDGDGPIYDLAFVEAEDPYTESAFAVVDAANQVSGQLQGRGTGTREWQDHRQAEVLAGRMDSSRAMAVVNFGKVASQTTDLASAETPGFHTFLHRTGMRLGEGVQQEPLQYRGRYSPYLVRLPATSIERPPLIVFLHGGSQNHLQGANYFSHSISDVISPGYFDPPAVVIFPLGRDTGWSTPASEQDFLETLDDVLTRLPIDEDRIVLSGISAGAQGTLTFGQMYPDRWSGLYPLAGGGGPDFFENLVNLPLRIANGAADPLGGVGPTVLYAPELEALGFVDYRIWLANIRSHVPIPALGNCVYRELVGAPRVIDPPRVVYTIDPRRFVSDPDRGIELGYDSAYWVSDLSLREVEPGLGFQIPVLGRPLDVTGDPRGRIDVTSLARPDRARTGTPTRSFHENITHGRDFCGPNPAVRTGDTWEESALRLEPGPAQDVVNGVRIVMSNFATATLDLPRMDVATGVPVRIDVEGDGPTDLRLVGPWVGQVLVELDGAPIDVLEPVDGAVVLSVDLSGSKTFVLRPLT